MKASKPVNVLLNIFIGIVALMSVLPFIWIFFTSFKLPVDAFATPPVFFFEPTLDSYAELWLERNFFRYLFNTVVVCFFSIGISLSVGLLAGYGLARFKSKTSFFVLMYSLVLRSFPRLVFTIPFYTVANMLGMFDTRTLLILIMVSINQPFTIWLLRSYFLSIPTSIEGAAMVDGCTRFQAFRKVVVPIMRPGIITAGIFTLLLAYNEYLIPSALTSVNAVTLPVAIAQFSAEDVRYWSMSAAGCISIALPIVIIVLILQRYLIQGYTAGAVKE